MLAKRHRQRTTDNKRRGVTLVEMLVTVAVLVIIMTILVQIFQAATGSVSAAQALQQLDDQLRRLDGILRADLEGVTARFTPPLDPLQNLGYFEYGENEFADNQGEDSDDYIRFTAKAPAGRPFTGRFWPAPWPANNPVFAANANNFASFPITITSDYAEIIYFVRNGNLYRRVFLIVPEFQSAIVNNIGQTFQPLVFGGPNSNPPGPAVSWQGVNDLSARPSASGNTANLIVLNTLGDLTNRENRAFMPRFGNDFWNAGTVGATAGPGQDGIADDINGDNIPDLYPSLYPNVFNTALINAPAYTPPSAAAIGLLAFPYVFPGAYSKAQALSNGYAYGWIHSPSPLANHNGQLLTFDAGGLNYLVSMNHNPLDVGDNLPTPFNPPIQGGGTEQSMLQTWWGFPTWRETLSPNWNDPTLPVWSNASQPTGLSYAAMGPQGALLPNNGGLLPPLADPTNFSGNFSNFRQSQQLFCDAAGQNSVFWTGNVNPTLWRQSWEDDLIMTGVRSFDVKAYDVALTNYADLGWGDDLRLYIPYSQNPGNANVPGAVFVNTITGVYPNFNIVPHQSTDLVNNPPVPPPYSNGTPPANPWPPVNPQTNTATPIYSTLNTFAHEGRMPPLLDDLRFDAQYGGVAAGFYGTNYPNYTGNIGDNTATTVRLRRVWDSWSIEYSQAPGTGVAKLNGGFPIGPPFTPPVYPSYPPPYPAPLRGIQIQVRVVDPTNQRIKSLTIRQDFTDKL